MDNTPMFISKMTSVFSYPVSGLKGDELQKAMENADRDAASKVRKFVDQCKKDECKWSDPDFGPNDDDEYGAESLYGNPPKPPSGGEPNATNRVHRSPLPRTTPLQNLPPAPLTHSHTHTHRSLP